MENATMVSYQAKMGWKMTGKREYKKYHSVFVPTRREIENFKKLLKKLKKLKNIIMSSFQAKIG